MSPDLVDLISDTATRPSPAMRKAMAEAEVGDEQRREDPTVNRLEETIAPLVGQESAVFLPTATMANEIAIKAHTNPGDEVLIDRWAHAGNFEGGGPAFFSGVTLRWIESRRGVFTPEAIEAEIRPDDPHYSRTRLLYVEQTVNVHGGVVWPLPAMQAAVACARKHRLKAHVDGARLFNAQAASGIPAATYGGMFDSVTICFSKGLGAPTGAVVAGSSEFCADARRLKHVFGGALRQAGILAAACLYALDHNVSRLAEDHANARHLAEGLAGIPGIRLDPPEVDSNMVFIRVDGLGLTPNEFCHALLRHGVRMGGYPGGRVRAVTHLDVDRAGIDRAVEAVRAVAGAGAAAR